MEKLPDDWERNTGLEKPSSVVMAWKKDELQIWIEDQSYNGENGQWQAAISRSDLDEEDPEEYNLIRYVPGSKEKYRSDRHYFEDVENAISHAKKFIKKNPEITKEYFKVEK